MDLISRSEALLKELATYYTAVPCVRGHDSPKYTINFTCVECHKERQKHTYINNSVSIRNARKQRYYQDPDKAAASTRAWAKANPNKVRERHRVDYEKNSEAYKARAADRRMKIKLIGGKYTKADVHRQHVIQNHKCYYCNIPYSTIFHIDHYISLAKGGDNSWNNIVISCPTCNLTKGVMMPDDFLMRLLSFNN